MLKAKPPTLLINKIMLLTDIYIIAGTSFDKDFKTSTCSINMTHILTVLTKKHWWFLLAYTGTDLRFSLINDQQVLIQFIHIKN